MTAAVSVLWSRLEFVRGRLRSVPNELVFQDEKEAREFAKSKLPGQLVFFRRVSQPVQVQK